MLLNEDGPASDQASEIPVRFTRHIPVGTALLSQLPSQERGPNTQEGDEGLADS